MKILQVVLNLKYGGLEKLVIQLSEQLIKDGYETEIVCLEERGDIAIEAQGKGIKVYCLEKKHGFDYGLIFKLGSLIKKSKANIVHTHNTSALIYGSFAARLAGVPSINTRHSRRDEKIHSFIWNLNKYVVMVSKDTKDYVMKFNRINKKKAEVVYNGINVDAMGIDYSEDFKMKKRKELGLRQDSFILGNIGRLVLDKDQATLIKAFRKLIKRKFNGELVIVGDGPLREKLVKLIEEYGLQQYVKLLGFRDDIPEILSIFDVYVLSSIREGVSLTLLEAMAASKPVIATQVGGNPEVVVEKETGHLVPCGFPERIESAVSRLYVNRDLAEKMAIAGKKRVENMFSLKHMTDGYKSLYEKM